VPPPGGRARLPGHLLREELRIETDEIDRDTELVSTGIIDSPGVVFLCTFLERNIGIEIPDQDVNAEMFDTIAKTMDYVRDKQQG
jgi:acyl carrier protein